MTNENVSFDSVVTLFDQDRSRSFLERFFTPSYFRLKRLTAKEGHDCDESDTARAGWEDEWQKRHGVNSAIEELTQKVEELQGQHSAFSATQSHWSSMNEQELQTSQANRKMLQELFREHEAAVEQRQDLEANLKLFEEKHNALDGNLAKLQQVSMDAEKCSSFESDQREQLQNIDDRLRKAETVILELLSQMTVLKDEPKLPSGIYEQDPTPRVSATYATTVSRGALRPLGYV